MIVLGIDPGTAALGYGVISRNGGLRAVDYGVLSTGADLPLPERLLAVHTLMTDLIELHAPSLIGVERLFFSRNAQTAFAVGQARGVVLLAAAQHGVPVREATPNEVKNAISGYGSADKEQVQRMLQVLLGLKVRPTPDDAADALAMAVWVCHRERAGEQLNSGRLDRAAVAPLEGGETRYEKAVREALRREAPARSTSVRSPSARAK
ncbi:MAG: crossover junction endodeoxyribonuclease RuvC [Chloroflexi bacterium]|nr:MAG: crossover junction endodeoxyribonuclease RuvC [Chloroflexota bacterium]